MVAATDLRARILLLEEDPTYARDLREGLERLGCEVVLLRDGTHGLARAVTDRFDVVLLSAELPGMNGFRVCNRIKRDPSARARAVFMMGAAGVEQFETHERLETRADLYLRKPIVLPELAAAIRNAVVGARPSGVTRAVPRPVAAAATAPATSESERRLAVQLAAAEEQLSALAELHARLAAQDRAIASLTSDLASARAKAIEQAAAHAPEAFDVEIDDEPTMPGRIPVFDVVAASAEAAAPRPGPPPPLPTARIAKDLADARAELAKRDTALREAESARAKERAAAKAKEDELRAATDERRMLEERVRSREAEIARLESLADVGRSDAKRALERVQSLEKETSASRTEIEKLRAELAASARNRVGEESAQAEVVARARLGWEKERDALGRESKEAVTREKTRADEATRKLADAEARVAEEQSRRAELAKAHEQALTAAVAKATNEASASVQLEIGVAVEVAKREAARERSELAAELSREREAKTKQVAFAADAAGAAERLRARVEELETRAAQLEKRAAEPDAEQQKELEAALRAKELTELALEEERAARAAADAARAQVESQLASVDATLAAERTKREAAEAYRARVTDLEAQIIEAHVREGTQVLVLTEALEEIKSRQADESAAVAEARRLGKLVELRDAAVLDLRAKVDALETAVATGARALGEAAAANEAERSRAAAKSADELRAAAAEVETWRAESARLRKEHGAKIADLERRLVESGAARADALGARKKDETERAALDDALASARRETEKHAALAKERNDAIQTLRGELAQAERRQAAYVSQLEAQLAAAAEGSTEATVSAAAELERRERAHAKTLVELERGHAEERKQQGVDFEQRLSVVSRELADVRLAHADEVMSQIAAAEETRATLEEKHAAHLASEIARVRAEAIAENELIVARRVTEYERSLAVATEEAALMRSKLDARTTSFETALADAQEALSRERDVRLTDRARIEALESGAGRHDAEVASMIGEIARRNAEIAHLEAEIVVLRGELTNVRRELDHEVVASAALAAQLTRDKEVLRRAQSLLQERDDAESVYGTDDGASEPDPLT